MKLGSRLSEQLFVRVWIRCSNSNKRNWTTSGDNYVADLHENEYCLYNRHQLENICLLMKETSSYKWKKSAKIFSNRISDHSKIGSFVRLHILQVTKVSLKNCGKFNNVDCNTNKLIVIFVLNSVLFMYWISSLFLYWNSSFLFIH